MLMISMCTNVEHLIFYIAVCVGSYLLFASAGPAFPEAFKHEDGGIYRGQWRVSCKCVCVFINGCVCLCVCVCTLCTLQQPL